MFSSRTQIPGSPFNQIGGPKQQLHSEPSTTREFVICLLETNLFTSYMICALIGYQHSTSIPVRCISHNSSTPPTTVGPSPCYIGSILGSLWHQRAARIPYSSLDSKLALFIHPLVGIPWRIVSCFSEFLLSGEDIQRRISRFHQAIQGGYKMNIHIWSV